jgi:hypothetical protein
MKKIIEAYKNINKKAFNLGANYGFKTAEKIDNWDKKIEKYVNIFADITGILFLIIIIPNFFLTNRLPILNIFSSFGFFYICYVLFINIKAHIETLIEGGKPKTI